MSIVLNLQVENYYKNDNFRPDRSFIIPDTTKTAIFPKARRGRHSVEAKKKPLKSYDFKT